VRAECAAHALAAREPYGVWGGFTETERLRLLATGWEDTADRDQGRVDVRRLEARLGIGPRMMPPPRRQPAQLPMPPRLLPGSMPPAGAIPPRVLPPRTIGGQRHSGLARPVPLPIPRVGR
jgi:hypothetical protein